MQDNQDKQHVKKLINTPKNTNTVNLYYSEMSPNSVSPSK